MALFFFSQWTNQSLCRKCQREISNPLKVSDIQLGQYKIPVTAVVQVKPFLVVLFKISGSSKLGSELVNDITMDTGLFTAPMVQCVRAPALH